MSDLYHSADSNPVSGFGLITDPWTDNYLLFFESFESHSSVDRLRSHIQEYPDYETQGRTIEELKANLIDFYQDISSGLVPDAAEGQTVIRYVNVVTPFSG